MVKFGQLAANPFDSPSFFENTMAEAYFSRMRILILTYAYGPVCVAYAYVNSNFIHCEHFIFELSHDRLKLYRFRLALKLSNALLIDHNKS